MSSRRFARLSERCTLKRAFIVPEVQKSYFQHKNPKYQVLTTPTRLGYLKNSLTTMHGNNSCSFNKSMASGTISYFTKTNFPSFLTSHNTLTQGSLLSKNSPVSEKEHAHSLSTARIWIYSTRIEKEGT